MGKIKFLFALFIFCINCSYAQYSYNDVQGIWMMEESLGYNECPILNDNVFFVFYKNHYLIIPTADNDTVSLLREVEIVEYGFSDDCISPDSISSEGGFLVKVTKLPNGKVFHDAWCNFFVNKKKILHYGGAGFIYLEKLPIKAQNKLFKQSINDHHNYAREFLEYDLCCVKKDNCHLLDNQGKKTDIIVPKLCVVIVRDVSGNLLKVEYEDSPGHVVYGYIKKKDLIFVDE